MNIIFYKKMKSYKEKKGFSQNKYIEIADILPKWNDIGVAYMKGLSEIARSPFVENVNIWELYKVK